MTIQMCLYKMRDRKQGTSVVPSLVVCDPTNSKVLIRVENSYESDLTGDRGGWFEVLSPGEVISWRGDRAERPGLRQVPFQTC